jgi:hypothetical protein
MILINPSLAQAFMDYLGLKDSSRDFPENCAISFFFIYVYYSMHVSKHSM